VGHVACLGEGRGIFSVLVGRPEGKREMGRSRCGWEDNIKMDGVNWIQPAQNKVQWQAFVST